MGHHARANEPNARRGIGDRRKEIREGLGEGRDTGRGKGDRGRRAKEEWEVGRKCEAGERGRIRNERETREERAEGGREEDQRKETGVE